MNYLEQKGELLEEDIVIKGLPMFDMCLYIDRFKITDNILLSAIDNRYFDFVNKCLYLLYVIYSLTFKFNINFGLICLFLHKIQG